MKDGGGQSGWRILCWGMVLLGLVSIAWGWREDSGEERKTVIIAHRAGAAVAPENTIAALECAIAAGADMAEVDIQMTADGVLIAIHDDNLARTTGLDQSVSEVEFETVRRLDAGSWCSEAFVGEKIPTLEQLLGVAKGRIDLILELTCVGEEAAVAKVIEQVQADGMEGQCALACAELDVLQRSKELAPDLDTVYIGQALPWNLEALDYVDGYSIQGDALNGDMVERVHDSGKRIYVWTVNTAEEISRVAAFGVDGTVTDDPALAIEMKKAAAQ